jgi:hypothetical protein
LVSDTPLLWPGFLFSPVQPVDDNGEYLRAYMADIRSITTKSGPVQRITRSPYNMEAQKAATNKKLSHGSSVVHDRRPTNELSGSIKG